MKTKRISLLSLIVFVSLTVSAQISMTLDAKHRGAEISPYQYGLFFEEINHAGDGGLYAELIRNRSFEDNSTPECWSSVNSAQLGIETSGLLNNVQKRCLQMTTTQASGTNLQGVMNEGYWGMNFVADSTYTLSLWVKASNTGYTGNLIAQLRSSNGTTVLGETRLEGTIPVGEWVKLEAKIKATGSNQKGRFALVTSNNGTLFVDVVSLFPYTWKGRPNGLRPDLAELLAETHPTFLRFPGGCFVEGTNSYQNAFQWKNTIGPIEYRNGHQNVNWGYRSSDGLGFDEYLQLCEDLNAEPMFVLNVGLGHDYTIPVSDLDTLVQNALDAIEYANGDVSTYWGARRAANGHPAPYGIKFIEIGNENYQTNSSQQSQQYAERYYMFYKAIKERYPDIITIGNVEAWGTDDPSWRNDYPVELVDEHYYRSFTWMRNNYHKYDSYSRAIPVYNGEYAANETGTYGTYGNMNSALGEAVYMLGMEKNSDVCRMASFAPIFMHESDPRWPYDMIHFNASSNFVTPSYYVQSMLAKSLGQQNLVWEETGNVLQESVRVGMGTWNTTASFDDFILKDGNGETLMADDFEGEDTQWQNSSGTWTIDNGTKNETATTTNCLSLTRNTYPSDKFSFTIRAKKNSGNEGFLIIFNYKDANNYAWWNVGGWNNSQHGIEVCQNGVKTTVAATSGIITTGQWYDLRVDVNGASVKCYLNNQLVHNVNIAVEQAIYQSAQIDEENGILWLKVVNPHENEYSLNMQYEGMEVTGGKVVRLVGQTGLSGNSMTYPNNVAPSDEEEIGNLNTLSIPPFSLNIYKLNVKNVEAEEVSPETVAYKTEDGDKYGYLFAHMHASKEITCYALSRYGQVFTDLFDSGEVFDTKAFTTTGGMRDSYICRMENGNFMLAGTDMTSALGWESNHIMDLMLSNDLVHWDKEVKIDLETPENLAALGLQNAEQMTAAWAPQIIYDPVSGNYMVYYSVGVKGDRHRIYYQMVDSELNVLTTPKLLFDPGYDVIDADIVWNALDKQYVMIYKWEGVFHLFRATAPYLVPTDKTEGVCQWEIDPSFDIYESGQGIEAPSLFRPIGSQRWRIGWMNYGGSRGYKFMELDEHCQNPTNKKFIQGTLQAQHGSFVKLTETEFNYLKTWEEVVNMLPQARSLYERSHSEIIADAINKAEQALNNSGTFDEEVAAMNEAHEALLAAVNVFEQYLRDEALAGNPTDMTLLLKNPDFTERNTGWEGTSFTTTDGNVAEHFNTTFDFYQTLYNMPEGYYEVKVQSFYRNGTKSVAWNRHSRGSEQLLAELYANDTISVEVMSIFDTDNYTYSPYTFPDDMATANTAFNTDNLYHNSLVFYSQGGTIKIGIRKAKTLSNDWCCFDNFELHFLGTTGIETVGQSDNFLLNNHIYDLQGRRVYNTIPYKNTILIRNGVKIMER